MAAAAHALLWRRHRWTALRSLILVALLHRLHCLAFLAASSPVWLLAAFLLGVVLVHSEPHVPLAAASEDEDRHLYKKIRRRAASSAGATSSSSSSSSGGGGSDDTSSLEEHDAHLAGEKDHQEAAAKAAAVQVAWTADDEHSIRSIGSLELERDARLEKLMSRRSIHRNLIDLDVHIIPAAAKNPFDLHHESSEQPGSAPSFLLAQHNSNPFDFPAEALLLRRHESFTAGAPLARPSHFTPYFVADVPEAAGGGDAAGSDSSSSSAASIDHHQVHQKGQAAQQQAKVEAAVPPAAPPGMAVDVELISDSSDDDMSLPGDDAAAAGSLDDTIVLVPPDEDVEDSFEVESITQQVAAAGTCCRGDAVLEAVEESHKIREHHILGPVPVIDSSPTSTGGAGAGVAAAALATAAPPPPPTPAAAAASPPAPMTAASPPTPAPAPAPAAAPPTPAAAAASPPTPTAASPPTPAPAASPPIPAPAASAPSAKPSKSKASSKKAVFGFFRK